MKKIVSLLVAFMLLISSSYAQQLRVFTIGDSTVQDYNDGYAPRKGWGQMLSFFFDKSKAVVYNKAIGGTSSKSFYEKHWADVKNQLKKAIMFLFSLESMTEIVLMPIAMLLKACLKDI